MSRILIVRGPHKGQVVLHEPERGPFIRLRRGEIVEVIISTCDLVQWRGINVGGPDEHDVQSMLRDRGIDPRARPLSRWTDVDGHMHFRGPTSRGTERPSLYRVFSQAAPDDENGELYAAEWCGECDTFADRCAHAPDRQVRRWVRFGPRFDRTKLDPDAPGSRESKWHLLLNWRQLDEPWITACDLIVYGPIIEEYSHAILTPVGVPMCRHCKHLAGVQERMPGGGPLRAQHGERGVSP